MWRVVDGQVVDEDGVEVEGVEPWGDSQAVCGIRVVTTLEQVGQMDFDFEGTTKSEIHFENSNADY